MTAPGIDDEAEFEVDVEADVANEDGTDLVARADDTI